MCVFRFAKLNAAIIFMLLVGMFLAPTALKAQDSSSMNGVVTDATGAILPGATITLTNKSTGTSYTQTTGKEGTYRFANVPPGEGYTATFTDTGFASVKVDNITLSVGITRTQDAKMAAGTTQVVEVSAANQQVTLNTTDASIGNNMDVQELNELPVYDRTNGIATLFVLQPGVDSNMGAVTGARVDQTEVTVDGLDVNDIAAGTTFGIVGNAPVDSVEQFTGTVAGLVPGVGTGSGGQFQLVTKHGTNQFHGNINEYHRDTTTEANTYFNNLVGVPRTPLIRNQFGGNVGGPIKKDKLFFFFEFNDSRIIQSASSEPIVPMGNLTSANPTINYINDGAGCNDSSRLNTTPSCISSLNAAQVMALDPQGVGFNYNIVGPSTGTAPNQTGYLASRYPAGNDPTQGDGVNTEGFRFTQPTPDFESTYIGRVDYNLTSHNKVFGRFTINRENSIQTLKEFPSDPVTHPFIDRSYGYVVSDVWTIGKNKVNQFYYGDNISKYDFPDEFNPTGANQYSFTGGLSGPYTSFDGQVRRVPIPVVRDDFNWQLGNHSVAFGGSFKFIKADSNLINDFNGVSIGAAGPALGGGLGGASPSVRPSDIFSDSQGTALNDYDGIFATSLGVIGQITTIYNYTAAGAAVPAGTGGPKDYRYFETEGYVSDDWKLNSKLTISYGLRYQVYSVPYETHGEESLQFLDGLTPQQTTFNAFFKDRIAQIAAENVSPTGLPNFNVTLGGKANHKTGFYAQSNKDFAPRVAFAYSATPKIVVNGGAGIVYDRTVINTINFLQNQVSYLFSNSNTNNLNDSSVNDALENNPRVGPGLSYSSALNPPPQPVGVPFTPFVQDGIPFGDTQYQENFIISPNLKDPYSIALNLGIQQDLPWNMVLKINYSGRLGRRLLADVDAGQILDNPDISGLSNQTLVQAFAGLTTQLRGGTGLTSLAPEPWFENVLPAGAFAAFNAANHTTLANNTQLVAAEVGQYANRGDMGEALNVLEAEGQLPFNVGTTSQFTSDLFLVNQGNSNYHGLLVTLDKNMSHGLSFGLNYTWSHAIDNTSQAANNNAAYNNFGFICDVTKPRACRGSADFDVRQETSANVVYNLPIGHGQQYLATSPTWVNEAIGGWSISALPAYRTGLSELVLADAYLASSYNQDTAIFTGNKGDLRAKVNVSNGTVWDFAGGQAGANKVLSEFRGPIGLEYGQRNLFKGPGAFTLNMGLAKKFPIIPSKNVNLIFRADGFNLLNHPNFSNPGANNSNNISIVGNAGEFGQITGVTAPVGGFAGARVAQFSLRLEF
jgi:Carboxypeptidase regulatory-like domain